MNGLTYLGKILKETNDVNKISPENNRCENPEFSLSLSQILTTIALDQDVPVITHSELQ